MITNFITYLLLAALSTGISTESINILIIIFSIGYCGGANLCTYHTDNVKANVDQMVHPETRTHDSYYQWVAKKTRYMQHYINATHIHNCYLDTKGVLLYSFDTSLQGCQSDH